MSKRYLSAEKAQCDDFNVAFTGLEGETVYDAMTHTGQWAMMTELSWQLYGRPDGKLGLGFGQKYRRNSAGELHKVEG